jgi:hypothetical protein
LFKSTNEVLEIKKPFFNLLTFSTVSQDRENLQPSKFSLSEEVYIFPFETTVEILFKFKRNNSSFNPIRHQNAFAATKTSLQGKTKLLSFFSVVLQDI